MLDEVDRLKAGYIKKILDLQGDDTARDFAKRLGISEPRLSNMVNGRLYGFSLEWLMRLYMSLGGEL